MRPDYDDLPWFLRLPKKLRIEIAHYVKNSMYDPEGNGGDESSDQRYDHWASRNEEKKGGVWYGRSQQCNVVRRLAKILELRGYFPTEDECDTLPMRL